MNREQPNLQTVAEMVGVSITTVHRALNDKGEISSATREKILEAAQKLNYRPNAAAQRLARRHNNLIGVITDILADPFQYGLQGIRCHAVMQKLHSLGYEPLL